MVMTDCYRCGRKLTGQRRYLRHMARPCDQDTVMMRRARVAAAKDSGVPQRPRLRGRKLMMRER
jgi:hypothetical protein